MMSKLMLEMKIFDVTKEIQSNCEDIYDYITNWNTELTQDDTVNCLLEITDDLEILNKTIDKLEEEFERKVTKDENK